MVERKLPKLKTRVRFPSPAPNQMPASFDGKLVVAISSRALFDLEESNRVFEERGVEAYYQYQLEHENEMLAPGIAFALVKKLLRLNTLAPARPRVEVILLSRNTADTGLRIMKSIDRKSDVEGKKEELAGRDNDKE